MSEGQVIRRCVHCGSEDVNLWASWNLTGEWVCNDCCPEDPFNDGDDE